MPLLRFRPHQKTASHAAIPPENDPIFQNNNAVQSFQLHLISDTLNLSQGLCLFCAILFAT